MVPKKESLSDLLHNEHMCDNKTPSSICDLTLDPFENRSSSVPDSSKMPDIPSDELLARAFNGYEKILKYLYYTNEDTHRYVDELTDWGQNDYLMPAQIEIFFNKIRDGLRTKKVYPIHLGLYLTSLIRHSHQYGGYNTFRLDTLDNHIDGIGYRLEGSLENPITLIIDGIAGELLGEYSQRVEYRISGEVLGSCGMHTNHCTFEMHDNIGPLFGLGSKHSTYKVFYEKAYHCIASTMEKSNTVRLLGTSRELFYTRHH